MKASICILADFSKKNFYKLNKKIYEDFFKELKYLNIIDVSQMIKPNKENVLELNENFKIFQPRNTKELELILKKNKFILYYNINYNFKYFKINFIISRNKIKKFFISNLGYNPENFNYINSSFISKIKIFFNFRFKYYLIRILSLVNLWPKIDYFFESSSVIVESINNGLSKKIKKIIGLDLSFYLNVIKINSKYYDLYLNSKDTISEEKIVFIDGMLFDHQDVILREGKKSSSDRNKYYEDLYNLLKILKNLFKKEIVVCLHPKNNISIERNDFRDLKCVKFETEKNINKAFIVLYHEGSSIIQAILLKKNILNIYGKYLGNYINERSKLYANPLKIKRVDLENFQIKDKEIFLKELKNSTQNFDEFIMKNITFDKNNTSIQQIIAFLKLNRII